MYVTQICLFCFFTLNYWCCMKEFDITVAGNFVSCDPCIFKCVSCLIISSCSTVICLGVVNEAQVLLFLYFRSSLNCSLKDVESIFFVSFPSLKQQVPLHFFGLIFFLTGIMIILKSMLVLQLITQIFLCNSHCVAPRFCDSAINIDLEMSD